MDMHWMQLLILFYTNSLLSASKVDRPRGVSLTKNVFYNPERDFTCLDGSSTIPFSQVNDDYCDCSDGSDEPGTSACPNGYFHCTNAGFKPTNLPSSRVNDGICDCCDGSDEWKREHLCADNCKELWKLAREDLLRQAETASRGFQLRKEYSDRGKTIKTENQQKLESLKKEVETLKDVEFQLRLKKEEAEKVETDAKTAEQILWDEFKAKIQEHQETRQAADAFTELDADKDGSISVQELQLHTELDPSPDDGTFTDDEIRGVFGGETVDAPQFIEVLWKDIGSKYVSRVPEPQLRETEEQTHPDEDEDEDSEEFPDDEEDVDGEYEDDLDGDDDEEDDEDLEEEGAPGDVEEESENQPKQDVVVEPPAEVVPASSLPAEPVWSERATAAIKTADEARAECEDNERTKKETEKEISNLEKTLAMDFGPDEAFHELNGNCYDFDTHEYTYKLCPFDKSVQVPKSGGSETNLGRWRSWSGPENDKYVSMKYGGGLRCWNGPDRSTEVRISCGDENKLLSASEPSRCEYRFEFSTPAACEPVHVPENPHDEL